MIQNVSRALSLLVVAASCWAAWPIESGGWYVLLGVMPALVFIWFPEEVDEYTFGTWHEGYRIDSHTPPLLIAIAGWVILIVAASAVLWPDLIAHLFGMV